MSTSAVLARLLPSLYDFLSADPPLSQKRCGTSPAAYDVAESCACWRRCIDVWRTVVGNDCLYLAILLHAGCLWCPNYAALDGARRNIAARRHHQQQQQQQRGRRDVARAAAPTDTACAPGPGDGVGSRKEESAPAEQLPVSSSVSATPPLKRRGKRGGRGTMDAAAQQAVVALAAAADAHAELADACPSSLWALHVLHFLRVEEVFAATSSASSPSSSAEDSNAQSEVSSSSGGSTSGGSSGSDAEHSGEDGSSGDDQPVSGAARQRGGRRARRSRNAARDTAGAPRKHYRPDAGTGARDAAPGPQWMASSSLLPAVAASERGGSWDKRLGGTMAAVLAHLQQQQQQQQQQDGEGGDALHGGPASRRATAQERHSLLLCATVTVVSEEEPLVQQVAATLVEEWLRLVAAPPPLPTAASSCADQHRRRMCEARHYWMSCLLKMAAYLDGVHSALREENAHIAAVLARQGIAAADAEDIVVKSLPAILHCALVEEALLSAAAAPAAVRLWMPPAVLLLPFHLLGRGSVLGIRVPSATDADAATRTAARAPARFVACEVECSGIHLGAEPREAPGRDCLGFGVRCVEPELLLEPRHADALERLLPAIAAAAATSNGAADVRRDHPWEGRSRSRWWSCTQSETAGSPLVDLYAPRTLLMLPIPTQGSSDSAADAHGADAGDGGGSAQPGGVRTRHTPSALSAADAAARASWRGPGRRAAQSAEEEVEVRRRHPRLYHAMYPHLRAARAAAAVRAGGDGSGPLLLLLCGSPRGGEAAALRQMGFTVRSGNHHGLSRSGGGTAGRLTLARDALGTTLEGMHLTARRVLSLHGLFTSTASNAAAAGPPPARPGSTSADGGVGKGKGAAAAAAAPARVAAAATGAAAAAAATVTVTPEVESVALGTVAATLALTCLLLVHSLLDELLAQPSLVLWTVELASFVLDVSLLLPRPVPRLLRADGLALALLPQPAQSLLPLVGLAATLVMREAHVDAAPGGAVRDRSRGAGAHAWHPWWSAFRAAVLRDAELPSCLHSGVWAVVAGAEAAVAAAAATTRWDASRPSCRTTTDTSTTAATAGAGAAPGRGGRRRTAGGGERVLTLATAVAPCATSAAGPTAAPHRMALVDRESDTAPHHSTAAVTVADVDGGADGERWRVPQRLCGLAVLFREEEQKEEDAAAAARWRCACLAERVRVVSGADVVALHAVVQHGRTASHPSRVLALQQTRAARLPPRLTSAAASALWESLEVEEMGWGTAGP
ncbi:hypothetical protein NESM_000714500 [Novymonas esmeraldas]|uniref:Uncharacterized protein n=1 Tax=Novymonas esmeraldas TaxID=1808958 RepID=A0AAW0EV80_9TRYP